MVFLLYVTNWPGSSIRTQRSGPTSLVEDATMQIPIDRERSHYMLPSEHRAYYTEIEHVQKKSNKSIFYITHYLSDEDVELSCQFRKKTTAKINSSKRAKCKIYRRSWKKPNNPSLVSQKENKSYQRLLSTSYYKPKIPSFEMFSWIMRTFFSPYILIKI